jgi:hypothetical protein
MGIGIFPLNDSQRQFAGGYDFSPVLVISQGALTFPRFIVLDNGLAELRRASKREKSASRPPDHVYAGLG